MKFNRILFFAAIIAVPQMKSAETAVPPNVLGHAESIVDFCARVDSKSADQYKQWAKIIAGGMSEKELAEARKSSEYQESYEGIKTELEKIPAEKAAQSCAAGLQGANK